MGDWSSDVCSSDLELEDDMLLEDEDGELLEEDELLDFDSELAEDNLENDNDSYEE